MSTLARFSGLAGPGWAMGLALAVLLVVIYAAVCFQTGLGTLVDVGGGLLLGAVVLVAATSVLALGLVLLRRIPVRLGALIGGTIICLVVAGRLCDLPPTAAIRLGAVPVVLVGLAGAGLSVLLRRTPGHRSPASTVLAVLALLFVILGATAFIYELIIPGTDPFLEITTAAPGEPVVPLNAPNPSLTGPYPIANLFYGSGTDRHRPEYGPGVTLKTSPVDASAFITPPTKPLELWTRQQYWGFEPNCFPLNARVWFPQAEGLFPLVLIVHGNHRMEESSDAGYGYLGELLASRGFLVASIDENFLNDTWRGDFGEERGVRSWLLLKHLELWRAWNEQEGNPFYRKVDMTRIALIGQSRGGEAILNAVKFNRRTRHPENANVAFHFGFDIKTLIALAPTDGQYRPSGPALPMEDINYLVLQGSHDGDLSCFAGIRHYRRISFTGRDYRMKAALYIYRANHSQFNTAWGSRDETPPLEYLLNQGALLSPEEQRTITQVYVSAFLDATLYGRREYVPLFRDYRRGAHWLPDTMYLSRFQDSDFRTIADFDEPREVSETTLPGGTQRGEHLAIWEQREMKTRLGQPLADHAIALGWNTAAPAGDVPAQIPSYVITLPAISSLRLWREGRLSLSFCLADTGEQCRPAGASTAAACFRGSRVDTSRADEDRQPIDMTLELVASDGSTARLPLSHDRPLSRAIRVTFSKWPSWERFRYRSPIEPVLQTFEVPLADFAGANPAFDPAQLRQIRFVFDRTKTAVILLDQIGITRVQDPVAQSR